MTRNKEETGETLDLDCLFLCDNRVENCPDKKKERKKRLEKSYSNQNASKKKVISSSPWRAATFGSVSGLYSKIHSRNGKKSNKNKNKTNQRTGAGHSSGFSRDTFILELGGHSWSQNILLFFSPLCRRADDLRDKLITRRRDVLYHRFSFITLKLPPTPAPPPLPTHTVPTAVHPDGG